MPLDNNLSDTRFTPEAVQQAVIQLSLTRSGRILLRRLEVDFLSSVFPAKARIQVTDNVRHTVEERYPHDDSAGMTELRFAGRREILTIPERDID